MERGPPSELAYWFAKTREPMDAREHANRTARMRSCKRSAPPERSRPSFARATGSASASRAQTTPTAREHDPDHTMRPNPGAHPRRRLAARTTFPRTAMRRPEAPVSASSLHSRRATPKCHSGRARKRRAPTRQALLLPMSARPRVSRWASKMTASRSAKQILRMSLAASLWVIRLAERSTHRAKWRTSYRPIPAGSHVECR
ncbi:hypothetical protein EDE12_102367 [Methylosinus sp. sav-2]|nr:hypothetical protein EDE12_102367 [Methylosinus sp. sav-2]